MGRYFWVGLILATNAWSQVGEAKLDIPTFRNFLNDFESDTSPDKRESRNLWRQILLTSEFQLPFRDLVGDEKKNLLLDTRMPGSQPRWVTGRQSLSRPFSFEELDEVPRDDREVQYFIHLERDFFDRDVKLRDLHSTPELLQWTMSWTAREIYLAHKKPRDLEVHCRNADHGLSALGLLLRGQAPADGVFQLFLYGATLGSPAFHPCKDFPKLSWGMAALRHPQKGMKEISVRGEVSDGSPEHFAKILGGSYTKEYDWIVIYDEKVWLGSTPDGSAIEWTPKKMVVHPAGSKSEVSFAKLLEQKYEEEFNFEKSMSR